jgi:AbrB family looped-hinge helix DNA binding protein
MALTSRLRLKVSPKGQITLPKKVRQDLKISNYVYLRIDGEKAVLEPAGLLDELTSIIAKEVRAEGYFGEEANARIAEKKMQLVENLKHELDQRQNDEMVSYDDAIKELELDENV